MINRNQSYYKLKSKATREKYLSMNLLSRREKDELIQRGRLMAERLKQSMAHSNRSC